MDGRNFGSPPQVIELSPGDHEVVIYGGKRYETYRTHVRVEPGQMALVAPVLKLAVGRATIVRGEHADGAKIELVDERTGARTTVSDSEREFDIPTDQRHRIVATKRGFKPFEQEVRFEDSQAERSFTVNLEPR